MSIQSFTLKNYRSFVDRTTIELRPLTLLYGYNNSGKSALLRALPLIADSLSGTQNTPIEMRSASVRGCHFGDLLSRMSGGQTFEIELLLNNAYRLKWTFFDQPKSKSHVISRFSMLDTNNHLLLDAQWAAKPAKQHKDVYVVQWDETPPQEVIFLFNGLLPAWESLEEELAKTDSKWVEYFSRLRETNLFEEFKTLQNLFTRVQWLSAVRTLPLRYNPFLGPVPKQLTPDGQQAADILAYDSISDGLILSKVSHWYETHFQQKVIVDEEWTGHFQIKLQRLDSPAVKVNMLDVGEGLTQVLPVLVAGAIASEGSTEILAIEEPESHLQPRFHATLAEYFCELVRPQKPFKVLLETHSENFLLWIQLAIAKEELDPKSVMIYWVRQLADGRSIAEPVTFDEFARPQGEWPRDVFYTDTELSKRLVQARRERSSL
jgi:predicted ATPase